MSQASMTDLKMTGHELTWIKHRIERLRPQERTAAEHSLLEKVEKALRKVSKGGELSGKA